MVKKLTAREHHPIAEFSGIDPMSTGYHPVAMKTQYVEPENRTVTGAASTVWDPFEDVPHLQVYWSLVFDQSSIEVGTALGIEMGPAGERHTMKVGDVGGMVEMGLSWWSVGCYQQTQDDSDRK